MIYRLGANHTPPPPAVRPLAERAALTRMAVTPCDWFAAIPADGDALGNDKWSNCWEVAQAWVIALRRASAAGDTTRPSRAVILAQFAALTGWDPTTGLPDDGTQTAPAMTAWCRSGVRVNSQTLDVPHWLTVDPANDAHVMLAAQSCGPLMATWKLPMAMQDLSRWAQAPGTGTDWNTVWGGHETCLGATDGSAVVRVRTWGQDLDVHPDIRRRFMIGLDVPLDLSPGGWLQTTGLTPAGLDVVALRADMAALAA